MSADKLGAARTTTRLKTTCAFKSTPQGRVQQVVLGPPETKVHYDLLNHYDLLLKEQMEGTMVAENIIVRRACLVIFPT